MDTQLLKKIGLTDGEARVYNALVLLGKSTSGAIIKKSHVSASKVYIILEKLIQKGLASYIVENNVKKFQASAPENISRYIRKKKVAVEEMEKEADKIITQVKASLGGYEEESAQIYKGIAGFRVAFDNILNNLEKGDDFLFFSISEKERTNKSIAFFNQFDRKREAKRIYSKGIIDVRNKNDFLKFFKENKYKKFKFLKIALPHALSIGSDRMLITRWGDVPIGFEIISKTLAKDYREFFYRLWNG